MKTTRKIRIAPRPTAPLVGPQLGIRGFWYRKVAGDAAFEEPGGNAIIEHAAYRKAVLLADLGARVPLAYFITGGIAHPEL